MKNLNRMLLFAKVIDTKSFSEAARQLGVGKSAVSMQISRLEKEIDTQLIHRSTRQLTLTEAGEQYYLSCARILEEVELASEQLKRYKSTVSGVLKVTCSVGFGNRVIMPMISEFMANFPDLEIDLRLDDENVNLLEQGFDLAIRIAELKDSSLIARPLLNVRLMLCAAPSYIEKHGVPASIESLSDHRWVLFTHVPSKIIYEYQSKKYEIHTKGQIRVNNEQARLQLVLAGQGLTFLHSYDAWEAINNETLINIPLNFPIPSTPITALYQSRKYLPKKTSEFLVFLKRKLDEQPWNK